MGLAEEEPPMRLPSSDSSDSSSSLDRSSPERTPSARRYDGIAVLRLKGRGRVVVDLLGSGLVTLRRGRLDDVSFEGQGVPRYLSSDCVHISTARGRLVLEGEELELEFRGGTINASLLGEFEVEVHGVAWGPARQRGRLDLGLRLEGIERARRKRAA